MLRISGTYEIQQIRHKMYSSETPPIQTKVSKLYVTIAFAHFPIYKVTSDMDKNWTSDSKFAKIHSFELC